MSDDIQNRLQACCVRAFPGKQDVRVSDVISLSSEFRRLEPGDLGLLKENRRGDDTTIMRLAQLALEIRARR